MAKGRKAMPSKIHKLHGSYREDRHGGELTVESFLPDPPDWLPETGKEEWRRVAAELHGLKMMTKLDVVQLETYCSTYALFREAAEKIHGVEGSAVCRTPNGYQQQSAWMQIYNNSLKQLQSLGSDFGLNPATRARMRMIEKQPEQLNILDILDQASKGKASANG